MRTRRARLSAAALLLSSMRTLGAGEASAQTPHRAALPGSRSDADEPRRVRPRPAPAAPGPRQGASSGTCRWAATACRPAPPATSAPARTPGRRTRSARACSGSCSSPTRTATRRRFRLPTSTSTGRARTPRSPRRDFPLRKLVEPEESRVGRRRGHEQRRVLAGRALRDLRPGRPPGPGPRRLLRRAGPPARQRAPRRAAQHADDDQRGLQPPQLLGHARPEPVQRREPVRRPRSERVPLQRREPAEPLRA